MRFLSFVLAALAVVGIVVQPIVPAYAVTAGGLAGAANSRSLSDPRLILAEQTLDEFILDAQIRADMREKLASHAARGEAAILSRAQMDELSRTRPGLYAKLMKAYRTASMPNLTAEEKKLVDGLTAGNVENFKAGRPAGCGVSNVGMRRPVTVASAGSFDLATTDGFNENCPSSNMTGAWVILGLMLTVIIAVPLFCAIAAQFGTAPAFCRGWSGP